MRVKFNKSRIKICAAVPPSKSELHRALIISAIAGGEISNYRENDDIFATRKALENLGAKIEIKGEKARIYPTRFDKLKPCTLDCKQSASTLRFLLPLCLLSGEKITFTGEKSLFARPFTEYENLCKSNGLFYEKGENFITVCGKLKAEKITVSGDISSQFITGILFVLPLLNATLKTEKTPVSTPYIDLTVDMLKRSGIAVEKQIKEYKTIGEYRFSTFDISPDLSSAAYLEGFSFLGEKAEIKGIKALDKPDGIYKEYFEKLKSGEKRFDFKDCPDLFPLMCAVSAIRGGRYEFVGINRLKFKESDRVAGTKEILENFGVLFTVKGDTAVLISNGIKPPKTEIDPHFDHRLVMAASVLCAKTGGEIINAESVNKSFPDYFSVLQNSGADIKII